MKNGGHARGEKGVAAHAQVAGGEALPAAVVARPLVVGDDASSAEAETGVFTWIRINVSNTLNGKLYQTLET